MSKVSDLVVVTGGCGFIGSNLVRWLLANTRLQVLNLDALTYAGNLSSLADIEKHERYQFEKVDITDEARVRNLFAAAKPRYVMHLAAESHVDRSIDRPADFIQTNVHGTYVMLQASLHSYRQMTDDDRDNYRFLHVSTDEVYGSLGPTGRFSETTPYAPHSPYAASKASSDHLVRAWHDTYGLPVIVTNCSNNYGPYQFPEKIIPVVILKALRGQPIPVYGTGENVRDWLHVEDHCQALTTALLTGKPGETYNIGGNNELKNIDLVQILCGILDELRPRLNGAPYSSLIQFVDDRPGHDLRYAIDASKIRRELAWKPRKTQDVGFRETVQWYLDNQAWWEAILDGSYLKDRHPGINFST